MRDELVRRELEWHEANTQKRAPLDALLYAPPAFDRVVDEGLDFLQLRPGEVVLDMGCGEGKETLALVRRGVRVVAIDLTRRHLLQARDKVRKTCPDAQVLFVQADAHVLPFAAGTFRAIYGKAVLHHLVVAEAAVEIGRLMSAGGRASLAEPMKRHPIFWLGRRLTPHLRTSDEHPLGWDEMATFCRAFDRSTSRGHMLLSPAAYVFRLLPGGEGAFVRVHGWLQRVDEWLLARAPGLRRWVWYGTAGVAKDS